MCPHLDMEVVRNVPPLFDELIPNDLALIVINELELQSRDVCECGEGKYNDQQSTMRDSRSRTRPRGRRRSLLESRSQNGSIVMNYATFTTDVSVSTRARKYSSGSVVKIKVGQSVVGSSWSG